jgi:hypothetical protein
VTGVPDLVSRIFLDTDFVGDSRLVEPVSLGLVSETGAKYYAVFSDGGVDRAAQDEWLPVKVVPHLPVAVTGSGWTWDTAHAHYLPVRPSARAVAEVRAFIGAVAASLDGRV